MLYASINYFHNFVCPEVNLIKFQNQHKREAGLICTPSPRSKNVQILVSLLGGPVLS